MQGICISIGKGKGGLVKRRIASQPLIPFHYLVMNLGLASN